MIFQSFLPYTLPLLLNPRCFPATALMAVRFLASRKSFSNLFVRSVFLVLVFGRRIVEKETFPQKKESFVLVRKTKLAFVQVARDSHQ